MTDEVVQTWAGRRITGARRIRYVDPDGSVSSDGPLELSFGDGRVCVLDAGSDGESLLIIDGYWRDPFAVPLSADNHDFIRESGRWSAFDLAREWPWDRLLGVAVGVRPLENGPDSKLIGVTVWAGPVVVDIHVDSDELVVTVRP